MNYPERIRSFQSIEVIPDTPGKRQISGTVRIRTSSGTEDFRIIYRYSGNIRADRRMAGMMITMPVINFTYFAGELKLDFPLSENDLELIRDFCTINNTEVFVNKICRRRYEFFRKEFLPDEFDITEENAKGSTVVTTTADPVESKFPGSQYSSERIAVLSSGGKESLLSYGMLTELGMNVYPVFFNESGGHWRTAKTSYDHLSGQNGNTVRIWSNVDRFYAFMLRTITALDQSAIRKRADTYPLQAFIFPVYVMASLPLIIGNGISGIIMGNEFDDPREMPPYRGIRHYYGVYDQSQDFASRISEYFIQSGVKCTLYSLVYPVAGNVVQRILGHRYPELFETQRSCHSCHFSGGKIEPCGKCTKCIGIMLFAGAAGLDLEKIGYHGMTPERIVSTAAKARMRLDPDELNYLMARISGRETRDRDHVTGIHVLPSEETELSMVPEHLRNGIAGILREYSGGTYILRNNQWVLKG